MQLFQSKNACKLKSWKLAQLLTITGITLAISLPVSAQTETAPSSDSNFIEFVLSSNHLSPVQLKDNKAAWQKALSTISQKEGAALFFDIDLNTRPSQVDYKQPQGKLAMETLANITDRDWKPIGGIQTFSRISGTNLPDGYADNVVNILQWATSLELDQRKLLLSGWLRLEKTPPAIHKSLITLSSWVMSDTAFNFLDTNTRFGFSLEFVPRIAYVDPKSGHQFFINLQLNPDAQQPAFEISNVSEREPLEKPDVGSLDFGDGMVLTAQELLGKAADVFKKRYVMDGRISQSHYFISGQLTQQAFEAAMQTMLTVAPVQTVSLQNNEQNTNTPQNAARVLFEDLRQKEWKDLEKHQVDTTWLRNKNWMRNVAIGARDGKEVRRRQEEAEGKLSNLIEKYGPTEQLPMQYFLERRTITVTELIQNRPGLEAELSYIGLSPSSTVTLVPGMALVLDVNNKQHHSIVLQLLSEEVDVKR